MEIIYVEIIERKRGAFEKTLTQFPNFSDGKKERTNKYFLKTYTRGIVTIQS